MTANLTGPIPDFIVESPGANNSNWAVAAQVFDGAWGWVPFGPPENPPLDSTLGETAQVQGSALVIGPVNPGIAGYSPGPAKSFSYSSSQRAFLADSG